MYLYFQELYTFPICHIDPDIFYPVCHIYVTDTSLLVKQMDNLRLVRFQERFSTVIQQNALLFITLPTVYVS